MNFFLCGNALIFHILRVRMKAFWRSMGNGSQATQQSLIYQNQRSSNSPLFCKGSRNFKRHSAHDFFQRKKNCNWYSGYSRSSDQILLHLKDQAFLFLLGKINHVINCICSKMVTIPLLLPPDNAIYLSLNYWTKIWNL